MSFFMCSSLGIVFLDVNYKYRAKLEVEVDSHGVDATYFVGVGELLFFLVEEVVGVDEELAGFDGFVAYLEVESEAGIEFLRAHECVEGAFADEVAVGGEVELFEGFVDEAEHAVDGGGGFVFMAVYGLVRDALGVGEAYFVALLLDAVAQVVVEGEWGLVCDAVDSDLVVACEPAVFELLCEVTLLVGGEGVVVVLDGDVGRVCDSLEEVGGSAVGLDLGELEALAVFVAEEVAYDLGAYGCHLGDALRELVGYLLGLVVGVVVVDGGALNVGVDFGDEFGGYYPVDVYAEAHLVDLVGEVFVAHVVAS